ncbi:MAG TPA: hypothetical protein VGK54_01340 [Chloroflexota bacterium]
MGCVAPSAQSAVPVASPEVPQPATAPAARAKTSECISENGLPDHDCTPGSVDSRVGADNVRSTICISGYTRTVRPPESVTFRIKQAQIQAYGLQGRPLSEFELDHLIPLELGGAPDDVANLWPEPWTGLWNARQKDAVENFLHRQVCNGAMSLSQAQTAIASNWIAVFQQNNLRQG